MRRWKNLGRVWMVAVFGFMYVPIAVLIAFSFNESKSRNVWAGFSLRWYKNLLGDEMILQALGVSLVVAFASAIIATVLGTLAAIGVNNMSRRRRAVVLGMVYNYLPFMILPLYTIMVKIDQSVIEAAQDLGASQFHILSRVLVPLAMPGITTGITMVFVPSISTFIISRMLGGGSNLLPGDLIEMQFLGNSYNYNLGSAMSLVLMVIVLLCMSFTTADTEEMEAMV